MCFSLQTELFAHLSLTWMCINFVLLDHSLLVLNFFFFAHEQCRTVFSPQLVNFCWLYPRLKGRSAFSYLHNIGLGWSLLHILTMELNTSFFIWLLHVWFIYLFLHPAANIFMNEPLQVHTLAIIHTHWVCWYEPEHLLFPAASRPTLLISQTTLAIFSTIIINHLLFLPPFPRLSSTLLSSLPPHHLLYFPAPLHICTSAAECLRICVSAAVMR